MRFKNRKKVKNLHYFPIFSLLLYNNNIVIFNFPNYIDAEKFCRKNSNQAMSNLNYHLVTAYSIHEKQHAREQIQKKTGENYL